MSIDQVIREARRRARMTQRELAKRLGVAQGAVGQWETGVTAPSIANRVDLARILNLQFTQLVPELHTDAEVLLKDPQIRAIVRQLLELPPSVREAVLMQLTAVAEALGKQLDQPAPASKPEE